MPIVVDFTAVQPGTIQTYVGTVAPSGYLICDGSSVSKTTYPRLFAIISTSYGTADGTHFNLPDLRGRFVRGVDSGSGHDPDASSRTASNTGGNAGNLIGSLQTDQYAQHSHGVNNQGVGQLAIGGVLGMQDNANATPGGGSTGNSGGNETRPRNVNANFIIKF